ncbi:hypothetical protein APQ14_05485 [Vibrio toranzoniae]|uniref:Uncharacterized protein n=1 Tax=Vibrio toranzoniae TaxID=1194427 RepID=A0A120DGY1_9VIBR|nr:hypothetical protein [Vibrio toranzoniae]KWU01626.1 hypothetical protein APQ14_05485 [Vibrio toranzoniae]
MLCGDFVLRCSLLSLALVCKGQKSVCGIKALFYVLAIHLFVFQSHELSGGTMLEAFVVSESLTGSNIVANSLVHFLCLGGSFANK